MKLYHISDTLKLGETMSQDYKNNLELVVPFVKALEKSEDCFYGMILNAKLMKSVFGKFGMRDMQTNYVKWATEGIFEYVRKTEFPESYSRLLSNYFYDNVADIKRLFHGNEVDYILTHTAPREMIRRMGYHPDPHEMELAGFLEYVMYHVKHRHWYCGHWHMDRDLTDTFTVLWYDTRKLE